MKKRRDKVVERRFGSTERGHGKFESVAAIGLFCKLLTIPCGNVVCISTHGKPLLKHMCIVIVMVDKKMELTFNIPCLP
ncbi:hypothetical protein M5689_024809 [Euphorbia peplus]|nr:hypothetical protein M5689_024809 [Euphorbia peplus]